MKKTLAIACGFVVLAVVWSTFAVPALKKYPTNLDVTAHYTGTFTLFVNPGTGAPLSAPIQLPLTIDRHIQAQGNESGSSLVVVRETITQKAGDLVNASQTNVYVMDRSTMKNVADRRAYALQPANVVNRSGDYRLNLPFDTSSTKTYPIYKNELGASYAMRGNAVMPTKTEAGLRLRNFDASVTDVPLDAAYRAELNKLMPLPGSMTLDQLKPQLKAAGLDVDAVLAALTPVITPADLTTLIQVALRPVELKYVLSFDGQAAVDPMTGAEVDLGATESVGVRAALTDTAALQTVLGHYPNVPQAVVASKALIAIGAAPAAKLISYRYQQTTTSVADIARQVKSMRSRLRLAEVVVPAGLLGAGVVMFLLSGWLLWRRQRKAAVIRHATPPLSPPEGGLVSVGAGSQR